MKTQIYKQLYKIAWSKINRYSIKLEILCDTLDYFLISQLLLIELITRLINCVTLLHLTVIWIMIRMVFDFNFLKKIVFDFLSYYLKDRAT